MLQIQAQEKTLKVKKQVHMGYSSGVRYSLSLPLLSPFLRTDYNISKFSIYFQFGHCPLYLNFLKISQLG